MNTLARTINDEALELRSLQEARDTAKAAYEELKKSYSIAERAFMDRLELAAVDSIKVDGTNFVPCKTSYGQIQDREAFVEWAQVNDEGLLETRERKSNVNELVRERLDNNEPLPPGLGFYVKEYVSQRGSS